MISLAIEIDRTINFGKNTKEYMSRYVQPNLSISDGDAQTHSPFYISQEFWSQKSKFRIVLIRP